MQTNGQDTNLSATEALKVASSTALQAATRLHKEKQPSEAEALLASAISADPANAELWNARGVMFGAMSRHREAVWCYREALAYHPNAPGIWTNLGNALTHLKLLKSAIACHERALAASKPDALLRHNLGISFAEAGRHAEAIQAFTQAIEINPGHQLAFWDRARSYLQLGNLRQAWPDYEIRLVTGQVPKKDLPGQKWDGSPYPGKRLLLLAEQGFGDMLWIARYLARAKALGGELVVECQPELMPLIAGLGIVDQLVPRYAPLPETDFWCYHCSLPGLFTPDLNTIPSPPKFRIPRDRYEKLRAAFGTAGQKLKVGIVWSGSVSFKKNHDRAQPLQAFLQAFSMHGVQLYSLQKGPRREELTAAPNGGSIIDLDPYLADFLDTSAAIAHLDLVIMTDTSVAHLAGSMGKPVWLLLGYIAHWLWLDDRKDSPWYPSMRLFRPRAEGDWEYVFDSAATDLMELVAKRESERAA